MYKKFSSDHTLANYPTVNKVWTPHHGIDPSLTSVYCCVIWREIEMTPEDEFMLKYPGKNGFKVQGTILRVR